MAKEKLKSSQGRKYQSFSMFHETRKRLISLHQGFEPRMTVGGFLEEVLDFYEKNHCPECGEVTAKKVRHQCGTLE